MTLTSELQAPLVADFQRKAVKDRLVRRDLTGFSHG